VSEILDRLKKLQDMRGDEIEAWFTLKRAEAMPFLTTSVDLRHNGLRVVPVDTNLFPAGFNNLSPRARSRAARFIGHFLKDHAPLAKQILIIPENHTRNMGYLENLAVMVSLFESLGLSVRLGSLIAESGSPIELVSPSGAPLIEYPLLREGQTLRLEDGFTPDLIVMNNDMTSGAPAQLIDLAQPVMPPVGMGWYSRKKSIHFDEYRKLLREFCGAFGLDPWLFKADFFHCGLVDFKERTNINRVAAAVKKVLDNAKRKHEEHGISDDPYVFIKADSGTYGMGIMTVRSPEEIFEMNKKDRNKMNVIKEGAQVSEVIIQEGIPTTDAIDGSPAEPMIYMIDGVPIGGMWRVNSERDAFNNLNAAGMRFVGMCDETETADCPELKPLVDCHFRSFGIIAALAALAAARENYDSYMLNL
jgi:glutamate--cysteine ligase